MDTYYVATLARYVLVDAANEEDAREAGRIALCAMYRERSGRDVEIEILTIRLATAGEIELMKWHNEMMKQYCV